jgi:hypothetical protein
MEFGQPIHPPAQAKVFSARIRHSGARDARGFFEHRGYRLTGIGYCSMIASLGLAAKAAGCELARLQAAHPYPYPRIGRAENILVVTLA